MTISEIPTKLYQLTAQLLSLKVKWISVLMFGMCVMMGVHFHQIGKKIESSLWVGVAPSHAAEPPSPSPPPQGSATSSSASNAVKELTPEGKNFDLSSSEAAAPSSPPSTPSPEKETTPQATPEGASLVEKDGNLDLLNLTPEEFQVLQSLVTYQKEMRKEKKSLEEKEKKLAILQENLTQKVEQLQLLKTSIEKLIVGQEHKSQQHLSEIVKMYESMKPQEAAQILTALDFNITIEIVSQMKGKKASEILANLPPEQAAQLTTALAQKSQDLTSLA